MALVSAAELWGKTAAHAIQLIIEYDLDPPFNVGSPRTAPPEVLEAVMKSLGRGDTE